MDGEETDVEKVLHPEAEEEAEEDRILMQLSVSNARGLAIIGVIIKNGTKK